MTKITRYFDRDEFLTPFDTLFDKLMKQTFPDFTKEVGADFFHNGSYPKVDVIEYDDHVEIEAEIPGLKKEDLSIKIEKDVLVICGGRREQTDNKNGKYVVRELKRSSFKRSFSIHESLDKESIDAKFQDGLLKINIKKVTKDITNDYKEVKIK